MDLTLAHWLYGIFTIVIIVTMIFRKGVVLPTILGTFIIAWVFTGDIIGGFKAIFQANLVAAQELFNIFLIIMFMLALLNSLRDLGADKRMIQPIQKLMVNGHVSFFVLAVVTYVISLFFWPTPAVPLICALLVPAAVRAGLPAIIAAVSIAIAGQGMALSSDYIVQVAPSLSAASGGLDTSIVADKALILSLISGVLALGLAYLFYRKQIRSKDNENIQNELRNLQTSDETKNVAKTVNLKLWSKVFAIFVPIALLLVLIVMLVNKLSSGNGGLVGGDGAAFVGGVAAILLLMSTLAFGKSEALNYISNHITDGFVFAFKAMGSSSRLQVSSF